MSVLTGRRRLLKAALVGLATLPVTAVPVRRARADDEFPLLQDDDTAARSIGYVGDAGKVDAQANPTFRQGQDCSNCKLYLGDPGEPKGACELVLGQFVLAKAWCKAWEQKPVKS